MQTNPIENSKQVQCFFDEIALGYQDTHGTPKESLEYRLSIIRSLLDSDKSESLLEIGCGTGMHLFPLSDKFARVIGTDLSPKMVEAAEAQRNSHRQKDCIKLFVDPAERLSNIGDNQVDVVLCVGAFEHMLEKSAVLFQVNRVLKPGGSFICLTPNGSYCWYRWLAHWLGLDSRHLSTDQFLSKQELMANLNTAGLNPLVFEYWNFIPKADMPHWTALLLTRLDAIGKLLRVSWLRGGIFLKAVKRH